MAKNSVYGWSSRVLVSMLRNFLCWIMIAALPGSLLAADTAAAMLYAKGTAWINGIEVPRTSAIFPGDLVQTRPDSFANINLTGSNVMVLADSLIQFEGSALTVEHGRVNVATAKGMSTRAGEITVTPTSNTWTEFEVTDADGSVQIIARKGDLSVSDGSQSSTLPQGQQTTRDESQASKNKKKKGRAVPPARGSILNSTTAMEAGGVVVGVVVVEVLRQGDNPASPDKP